MTPIPSLQGALRAMFKSIDPAGVDNPLKKTGAPAFAGALARSHVCMLTQLRPLTHARANTSF